MNIDAVAAYCERLWNTRSAVSAKLDEIASYVAPDRQGFGSARPEGDEGRDRIWDSTPEDAALTLASALHGMLTNPATDWLALDLIGTDENEDAKTADFVQEMTQAMLDVFSDPATGFNNEVNAFYLDLVCLGWAVFLTEYKDGRGVRFRVVPPAQAAVAENADGRVDTVLRRFSMTPQQLFEEFGGVSDKVKTALEHGDQTPVPVSHLVMPREKLPKDAEIGGQGAHGATRPQAAGETALSPENGAAGVKAVHAAPFVSIHFETETKHILRHGFFDELPYQAPRWSKRSGEIYGRGPGHACLPDMRVLNRVALSQLVGAEKLADPPMVAASESVIGKLRTHAGGITTVDAGQVPNGDPAGAVRQLGVDYRLDVAEVIIEKRREAVRAAFLNDRIQLAGGPDMTATEVLARERKQNLVLGPVLGRLENEFLGPLVDRVFLLLLRNSRIEVPAELDGRDLRARYVSPISRAQRKGEAEAFALAMEYLAPAAQADMTVLDNFDFNRVARDSQDLFGYPRDYLRPDEEVKRMREERAEQQREQRQMAAMAEMAKATGGGAVLP